MTDSGLRPILRTPRLLLVLLLVASTAAAAGPALTATAIRGDAPLRIESGPAKLLAEAGAGGPVELDAVAQDWTVRLVSELIPQTVNAPFDNPLPVGPDGVNFEAGMEHSEVPPPSGPARFTLGGARHEASKVLVVPLSDDYRLLATSQGRYAATCVPATLLEESHDVPNDPVTPHPHYYNYTADPSLRLNLTGASTVSVTGDVEVYVWGFRGTLQGDGGPATFENGYTGQVTQALPGSNASVRHDEYYNYTVLRLHGAQVSLHAGVPLQLYGNAFDVQAAGQTELVGAAGSVGTTGGTYRLSGDATVAGGSFQWARRDDGAIGVRASRVDAAAGSVSFVPTPIGERWWFPYSVGAGVLGAVAALAFASPSVAGHSSPVDRGSVRARGYARWALWADAASRYRRAAFWMGLAARASPREASFLVERGIFLRLAGRPEQALKAHRDAHDLLRMLPDASMAHNAYEAAKAAVGVNLPLEALDWLRLAVETEPALAEEMQLEPEFAPLRAHPDYQSLTGPARLGGLLGA